MNPTLKLALTIAKQLRSRRRTARNVGSSRVRRFAINEM